MTQNPLGYQTLNKDRFKLHYIEGFNVEGFKDLSAKGELLKAGSRTFAWRLFLGLVPEEKNFPKWVSQIRQQRLEFYRKSEELRITKNKDLDPKIFNPLAAHVENNPWNDLFKEKETREVIT